MASPKKLAHVALKTGNLAKAKAWYLSVLEARVKFENEVLCFMSYDDEHHRVVLVKEEGFTQGATTTGMHHMSFTFANLDDLFDTYEKLKTENTEPVWTINHGPTLSMYYLDPMGNHVELQIDIMSMEEADNFMHSDIFTNNPIGIEFDANELNEKRKAGTPYAELIQYGTA
jgi:catechol-2,3-dioxygenase